MRMLPPALMRPAHHRSTFAHRRTPTIRVFPPDVNRTEPLGTVPDSTEPLALLQFRFENLSERQWFVPTMPKKCTTPDRPRDLNRLAVRIGQIATHEIEDESPSVNPAATKRGDARAAALSSKRRKAIATKSARARWKK